ncbi:hypothetical protein [Hydrogenophaga pseudoflava]|uniref:hypothetical protein n=1 Tax=Hydrogenophaga pseudoflava TaxID=47421 RepID=UPI0027E43200|nr:hypothetical protein [Hydrogenophaga pseudoflava]MDQ7745370.1 hypothetical protein [Hydrogenophaga pseudoflava]
MDILTLTLLFAAGSFLLKTGEQRQRISLLGTHLAQFQIEKLMERLNDGYLRALDEPDAQRQQQIWSLHSATEEALAQQFARFAEAFSQAEGPTTWVNRNPLPYAHRWLPAWLAPGFDARALMRLHAQGIARVVANPQQLPVRDRARTLLAELYLMQHSCHWFCRSRSLASARLLARHKTSYEQVLQAVSPATRRAYQDLTGI